MLRLFLPPNLAAAAARDAIAVKMELDPAEPPPAALLPALALLSQWAGGNLGPPPVAPAPLRAFLQLSRAQLRDLVKALPATAVFRLSSAPTVPLAWQGDHLSGVSEYLQPVSLPSPAPAAPQTPARRPDRPGPAATPMTIDGSEHFLALTLPSREHPQYAAAVELVKSAGFTLEPSNRKWWLRDRHKALSFLAAHGERLRQTFDVEFTPNFAKNTAHLQAAEILCEVAAAGSNFEVTVGLRAGPAAEAAVREAVATGRGYVEAAGRIFLLDPARVQKLAAAQRALAGEAGGTLSGRRTHRVAPQRAAEVEELLNELSPGFQPPEAWREKTAGLRELSHLAPAPLTGELARQLRSYQRLGAAWLWHLHRHGLGGVLADEMGLGKTLQALALLSAVAAQAAGPTLVVCPASLVENWRREALRFAGHLQVFVHHGGARLATPADLAPWHLVITSYGTLSRDRALFADAAFACVVGDEAQHVKNRRSQNAQALRSLRAASRFLLTGTPLENSLEDLRSLFEFVLPGYIERVPPGLRGDERTWHDARLRAKTAPYILRRTKQAVAPELPEKIEQVVWCELAPAQAALYRATQEKSERELFDLEASGAAENRVRMAALTQLLRLRQICCDPRLVAPGGTEGGPAAGAPPPPAFADSAKLEAFRELIAEAVDDGHRVLVFSQFTSLLALLRPELEAQGMPYCYLDGAMPPAARQREVDRFQAGEDIPLFLLSLKAGGVGLNLTGADTVIHFDPWWNPAVEAQATDRAHRIGQSRVVTSYKLVCSGTVEEQVLALQAEKRALLADVFAASDALSARLSLQDLKDLLRP